MTIELEFLDSSKTRLHTEVLFYNYGVPIPNVGEKVVVEGHVYVVKQREFMYLHDGNIAVSFWCEDPSDTK